MEAIEALVVSQAIQRTVCVFCAPLLLYLGGRLLAQALDYDGQARAELRDKYKFQLASFLPGSACILLAMVIGLAMSLNAFCLSKSEEDLLLKLGQSAHPAPQKAAPAQHAGPGGVS